MGNMIFLDFEQYAEELLNENERKEFEDVEVEVYIDTRSSQLGSAIYCDKLISAEQCQNQDRIIRSFLDQLRTDQSVQSWLKQ